MNPAVTLATMLSGHTNWKRGLLYLTAQFSGAAVGALFQASSRAESAAAPGSRLEWSRPVAGKCICERPPCPLHRSR